MYAEYTQPPGSVNPARDREGKGSQVDDYDIIQDWGFLQARRKDPKKAKYKARPSSCGTVLPKAKNKGSPINSLKRSASRSRET